jgi:hypothetical protein
VSTKDNQHQAAAELLDAANFDAALEGLEGQLPGAAIPADLLRLFESVTHRHEPVDGRVTCDGELITITVRMRVKAAVRAAQRPAYQSSVECDCVKGKGCKGLGLPHCRELLRAPRPNPASWSQAPREAFPKFRELAARLRQIASTLPECNATKYADGRATHSDCRCLKGKAGELVEVYRHGNFVLRCRPGRCHVEALAAHYDKPKVHARPDPKWDRAPTWQNVRRPAGADELLAQLEKELA